MKKIQYVDSNGRRREKWIRDNESQDDVGISDDPPDLDRLDFELIKTQVHNELSKRGLKSWRDVQKQQTALTSVLTSVLKRHIVALYRSE